MSEKKPKTKNIDIWDKKAKQLWESDEKVLAIKSVFDAINKITQSGKEVPVELFEQVVFYLFFSQDYHGALAMLEQVKKQKPNDLQAIQNCIVCLNRLGKYEEAILASKEYITHKNDNPMIYDVLSVAYYNIRDIKNATKSGNRSLFLKHKQSLEANKVSIPIFKNVLFAKRKGAKNYLKQYPNRTRNVISFSLFGSDEKYLHCGIRNLMLLDDIYKGWEVWIYHDNTVPKEYLNLYEKMGATLFKMPDNAPLREKLTWRFLVANHTEVSRFLVRDIDSVINIRERIAVDVWIQEDTLFHLMRDWWSHTELILAGMWGGVGGLLPDMKGLIRNYPSSVVDNTHVDQYFLRNCIWMYITASLTQHDRFFNLTDKLTNDMVDADRDIKMSSCNPWVNILDNQNSLGVNDISIGYCEGSGSHKKYQEKKVAPYIGWMQTLSLK